ncbi:PucR family transcriptional regulator [Streptomyces noursei]|uniref:PucR family transcriptional regulator n=1 Tax=Streptomyces noursei TaxID=1971 RepID=UPI0011AED3E3|nr:helix-turn-helix domain-containing protein [Streptomyces noursei]
MPVGDAEATERLAVVASAVGANAPEVSRDVWEHLLAEIPQLRGDEAILGLLRASVSENVVTLLHIFEHDIFLADAEAPVAAVEYARRLAQRNIPISALVRAYRIGHLRFLQWCLDELHRRCADESVSARTTRRMLAVSFDYIDRVTEQVIEVYQLERDRWLLGQTAARTGRVREILDGDPAVPDRTDSVLGYRLRQHHVGLVLWLPERCHGGAALARLDRLTGKIAAELNCAGEPLFVARDEALAWAWLPFGTRGEIAWPALADTVEGGDPTARVCAGEVESGIDGFRRTHRQALRAQELALAAATGLRVTAYPEFAPIALMCQDIDSTRAWVWNVLGDLATDDEHSARLRETLQIFLATGGSYTATAGHQILHKNTVQYRIRKAEETMGRSVHERPTELGMALLACRCLGSPILRPAGGDVAPTQARGDQGKRTGPTGRP